MDCAHLLNKSVDTIPLDGQEQYYSMEDFLMINFSDPYVTNCSGNNMALDKPEPELEPEMTFNDNSLMVVIGYSVLFLISAIGNLTVFLTLFRNRHRRSRVNLFIMHLAVADLIVTFLMMPLEIGWNVAVTWNAGDAACRLFMFIRAFGFYLSSFILVTISLDRYFAITQPLSLNDADRRGKLMLVLAWLFSIAASIPQSVIFHVERHPEFTWFTQCVTFNFFPSPAHELAYNLFTLISVYVIPLTVIIVSYSLILCEMSRKTRESKAQITASTRGGIRMHDNGGIRRSGIGRIEKARTRTLKMTIVIVSVFIVCWAPYFIMSTWWWFDQQSANEIHPKLQKGLFLFAVSNSCVNPIVYGMYATKFAREFKLCCGCCYNKRGAMEAAAGRHRDPNGAGEGADGRSDPRGARKVTKCVTFTTTSSCSSKDDHHDVGHDRQGRGGYGEGHRTSGGYGEVHSASGGHGDRYDAASGKEYSSSALLATENRSITPPHIAHGRGTKAGYEKYLII